MLRMTILALIAVALVGAALCHHRVSRRGRGWFRGRGGGYPASFGGNYA